MDTKALRQKILDLAIRGKLVPQDPNDEPASVLLERIHEQKQQMFREGKLKKKDIKNDSVIFVGEDNLHYEKFADGSVKCIEEEIPFELPKGWAWTRFSAITINRDSERKPISSSQRTDVAKIYDYYGASGKIDKIDKYIFDERLLLIGEDGANLVTRSKPIAFFAEGQYWVNNHAHCIDATDKFILEYLCFYINAISLEKYVTGSAQPKMTQDNMNSILIPLPPYSEQKRMSQRLNEVMYTVDNIEIGKAAIRELASKAKSKILDLAIRGQLVPQNPDDEPASVLLERIRAEKEELIKQGKIKRDKKESIIFKGEDNSYYEKIGKSVSKIDAEIPFDLSEGWEWCKLGSLCSSIQYGLSNSAESSGTHKLLRITDIQNGSVDWDTVPYTTPQNPETYILKSNDIVFARTGATVGKSFLIDQLPYESVYASFLIRIRLLKFISPQFIYNFFNSPCYWKQISNKAVGVGQPNCNGTSLSNLFIPIPPAKVQDEIVSLISKLYEHIDSIEKSLS